MCLLAAQATVLHLARLGAGACVAVAALVHARTVLAADRADELSDAGRETGLADAAFGVRTEWTDRLARYRRVAELRCAECAAHADDTVVG